MFSVIVIILATHPHSFVPYILCSVQQPPFASFTKAPVSKITLSSSTYFLLKLLTGQAAAEGSLKCIHAMPERMHSIYDLFLECILPCMRFIYDMFFLSKKKKMICFSIYCTMAKRWLERIRLLLSSFTSLLIRTILLALSLINSTDYFLVIFNLSKAVATFTTVFLFPS